MSRYGPVPTAIKLYVGDLCKISANSYKNCAHWGSRSKIERTIYMGSVSGYRPIQTIINTFVDGHERIHRTKFQAYRIIIATSRGQEVKIPDRFILPLYQVINRFQPYLTQLLKVKIKYVMQNFIPIG